MRLMKYMAVAVVFVAAGACTSRQPKSETSLVITCIPKVTPTFTAGDYALDGSGCETETGKLATRLELPYGGKTFVYDSLPLPFQIVASNVYTFVLDPTNKTIQKVKDSTANIVWERDTTSRGFLKFIEERKTAEPSSAGDSSTRATRVSEPPEK